MPRKHIISRSFEQFCMVLPVVNGTIQSSDSLNQRNLHQYGICSMAFKEMTLWSQSSCPLLRGCPIYGCIYTFFSITISRVYEPVSRHNVQGFIQEGGGGGVGILPRHAHRGLIRLGISYTHQSCQRQCLENSIIIGTSCTCSHSNIILRSEVYTYIVYNLLWYEFQSMSVSLGFSGNVT